MGFLDELASSISNSGSQSGSSQRSGGSRPGKICPLICVIDKSNCPECLQKQEAALAALDELRDMERAFELADVNPAMIAAKKITKCPLCSAPFEKGAKECPYCSTPYPEDALLADVPATRSERQAVLLEQAEKTYGVYVEYAQFTTDKGASGLKDKAPDFLQGIAGVVGGVFKGASAFERNMSGEQIRTGAATYGVSYSDYIAGIMSGSYKTVMGMKIEEMDRKLGEMEKQRQEQERKEAERRDQWANQMRNKINSSSNYTAAFNLINTNPPKYMGGPQAVGSCCGNCIYYMPHDNKCAESEFHHPTGASDYCNDHRSR